MGITKLPRRRIDFQDSGLDSDSDFDESQYQYSQNTVTWVSWIITTITTVITTITEAVGGHQDQQNHLNTRVPLKHSGGVSWYQYPVLWLYKLAFLVHRADIWLLTKIHSVLNLDSWGTSEQRRKWALIILLIPLIIWAGIKLVEWLWEEDLPSEGLSAWLLYPVTTLWDWVVGPLCAAWGWVSDCFWAGWDWFDGSWFWAPWVAVAGWWKDSAIQMYSDETATDSASDYDWGAILTYPFSSIAGLFSNLGGLIGTGVSALGEGAVSMFNTIGSFLAAAFAWLVDCVTSVPSLLSSMISLAAYPFTSMSWGSTSVDYTPSAPPAPSMPSAQYTYSSIPSESANLEQLLRDKHLLDMLARNLLSSREFEKAMAERQSTSQAQVTSIMDSAISAALSKIDLEFNKVKEQLGDKQLSEESSVEAKMNSLKQQIQELQMALMAHKALVSEQAVLGNRLEARVTNAEQLKMQQIEEDSTIKEQILLEVAKIRDEMYAKLMDLELSQAKQKVVVDSGDFPPTHNPTELEAFVNSTVEKMLAIYDADKIAKVDYALATSGGSVLNVRCTETFSKKNAQYYMWGYPLWSKAANDPRIALEPGMNPGECWAFTGSRGYLVIELSENITVTAFTMEHLPRSLSPTGNIDTAPKEFRVMGLESEQDDTPILLGRFKYEDNGASLQHFQALEVDHGFKIVELVIESNHGNLEYTCLYRFRVHGQPVRLS